MMRLVGTHVRKQFESWLDYDKMKLVAIRADYVSLMKEELEKSQARGNTQLLSAMRQNFIMLFGCRPGMGVLADT